MKIFLDFLENPENNEIPIIIRNSATGEILHGDELPPPDEVEEWLNQNPGYELISRDTASDSEDDQEEEIPMEAEPEEKKEDEFEGEFFFEFFNKYLILIENNVSGLDEETRNRRIIEKARNEEDEYESKNQRQQMESYYATAHRIREKIVKQHSTLGGGDPNLQLKPYQVFFFLLLKSFGIKTKFLMIKTKN